MKGFLSTESRCVTGPENILFLGVLASFSPEMLQAGAVKGLKTICVKNKQTKNSTAGLLVFSVNKTQFHNIESPFFFYFITYHCTQ